MNTIHMRHESKNILYYVPSILGHIFRGLITVSKRLTGWQTIKSLDKKRHTW